MPTLTRLLFIAVILGLILYGSMWGLVLWVKPVTVELTVEIPQAEIELKPWPYQ